MEAEKEKIVIGVRRYLIFQDHIIYFAVHRIMLTILIVPHYAELYTIVGRPNVFRDRKSTRLNSSHSGESRMPSSA